MQRVKRIEDDNGMKALVDWPLHRVVVPTGRMSLFSMT